MRDKEIRHKLSESKKGNKNPMFGKIPWNKGKTKCVDERIKKQGLKSSITKRKNPKKSPMLGKTSKFKGIPRTQTVKNKNSAKNLRI